jgi:ferritin-like metal-binding protein YciE
MRRIECGPAAAYGHQIRATLERWLSAHWQGVHQSGRKNQFQFVEDTMKEQTMQELYTDQLRDLYDAERQIIKALPKMIRAASSSDLKRALEEHLEVTKEQEQRIAQIFETRGEKVKAQKCKGMEGVLKEGAELVEKGWSEAVLDVAIIAAAQRVEHYEMAGYGCARTYAELLGDEDAGELLQKTLGEEKDANEKLTELAETINQAALEEGGEAEAEEETSLRKAVSSTKKRSAA